MIHIHVPNTKIPKCQCQFPDSSIRKQLQVLFNFTGPVRFQSDGAAHAVNASLDPSVDVQRHLLEWQLVVDLLDGARDARLGPLRETLGGGGDARDAALPSRGPAGGLRGEAFLGAREHHVEWGETRYSGHTKEGGLTSSRGGNSDRHFEDDACVVCS